MTWADASVFDAAKAGDITVSQSGGSTETPTETTSAVLESVQESVQENVQSAQPEVQAEPTVEPVQEPKEPQATQSVQQTETSLGQTSNQEMVPKTWKEVLKDSGFDDWSIKLLETKQAKGSVKEYLQETAIDYKELPSELILMKRIQDENPGITPRVLEFKLKEELKKYPLDPDLYDEEQIAIGREMLEMDVNRVRQTFIEKQKQYLEPAYENPLEAQMRDYQRQQQEFQEAYKQSVLNNQFTQGLMQNKRLVLGDKEKFNFEVGNPNELVDMVLNPESWQQAISNPDGTPKIDLLLEAAAYVKYKNQIHQQLINYGKTLGEKKVIEEDLHNIPQTPSPTPGAVQKDIWEAIRDGWK